MAVHQDSLTDLLDFSFKPLANVTKIRQSVENGLSYLDINLLASIVKDTMDEMSIILKGTFKDSVNYQTTITWEAHRAQTHPKEKIQQLILVKCFADIEHLHSILAKGYDEMHKKGSFLSFETVIKHDLQIIKDELKFIEEYASHKIQLKTMKASMQKTNEENKLLLGELDEKISRQENEIKDCTVENRMRINLVDAWDNSRFEQLNITFVKDFEKLNDTIEQLKKKTDIEQRHMQETEKFYELDCNKLEVITLHWIETHHRETTVLDSKIKDRNQTIADFNTRTENIRVNMRARQMEIDQYRKEQQQIREQIELEQKKLRSARRIQKWWRNIMTARLILQRGRRAKKGKSSDGNKKKGK